MDLASLTSTGCCTGLSQQQVQRPQAQHGEHVGAEDQEQVMGDAQDARDGVHLKTLRCCRASRNAV